MILKKIEDLALQYSLFENVPHITVACSGGADSMALLHALVRLSSKYGFSVSAAHFNHKIRGDEALRDQLFVEKYCSENNIPFVSGEGDVPEFAQQKGISTELAAREMRYAFLQNTTPQGVVATAHHAGDNLETVLFNLSRGTALAGLCGIPVKRDIFIRPLLFCTRDEIERYCLQNEIQFVTDSTNSSLDYSRNFIRNRVVPQLKQLDTSLETAVLRTTVSLKEDEEFLSEIAKAEYRKRITGEKLHVKDFSSLPKAIAKRVIKLYYSAVTGENPDFLHITEIYRVAVSGGRVSLPKKLAAVKNGELLCIESAQAQPPVQFSVEISEKKADYLYKDKKIHNLLLNNSLDCDKIVGKLVLRTREAGDRVYIKGRGGTKTLKKLYNEYKIPACQRENLPILTDDKGIVWIAKIGVAQRCAVGKETQNIYCVEVKEIKGEV